MELHTFPPTPSGGLAPEEQQFLGHTDGVATGNVTLDIGSKPGERQTANDSFVRLSSTVPPPVVMVETTVIVSLGPFSFSYRKPPLTQLSTSRSSAVP